MRALLWPGRHTCWLFQLSREPPRPGHWWLPSRAEVRPSDLEMHGPRQQLSTLEADATPVSPQLFPGTVESQAPDTRGSSPSCAH